MPIPIIDLFAGPGGLAEGFSSLTGEDGERIFRIGLSIEKEKTEHDTLRLRSFIRQFPHRRAPEEYYAFLKGQLSLEQLYNLYPDAAACAAREAWQATLGKTPEAEVDQRIHEALQGETEWVLIGGPPCQAYSMAGRSRVGGIHAGDNRVFLYKEYLRIIAKFQPAVFVMENVKGLLSAQLEGEKIFPKILDDLRKPSVVFPNSESVGYQIFSLVKEKVKNEADYLIKAEEYGIPQKRHRVILLGVREDIHEKPEILQPATKTNLRSIIGMLPPVRSALGRQFSLDDKNLNAPTDRPKRIYRIIRDSKESWNKQIEEFKTELAATFLRFDCKSSAESGPIGC